MNVLSFDPGLKNFGFCVSTINVNYINNLEQIVLHNGLLSNTINQMSNNATLQKQAHAFLFEVNEMCQKFSVDTIIMERFMGRGVKSGLTSEVVCLSLGLIFQIKTPVLISAATWKNSYKKNKGDLDSDYLKCRCINHIYDAAMIGLYGASLELQIRNPFKALKDPFTHSRLIASLEKTTTSKLINRRNLK